MNTQAIPTGYASKMANGGRILPAQDNTVEALRRQIEALQEANAALKAAASVKKPLRLKVSEKGAVSLYGIHSRFPITVYAQQWLSLLDYAPTIREFIEANRSDLSWKE